MIKTFVLVLGISYVLGTHPEGFTCQTLRNYRFTNKLLWTAEEFLAFSVIY